MTVTLSCIRGRKSLGRYAVNAADHAAGLKCCTRTGDMATVSTVADCVSRGPASLARRGDGHGASPDAVR